MSTQQEQEIEVMASESKAMVITSEVTAAIIRDLGPIADRLPFYKQQAESIAVRNKAESDVAAGVCKQIAYDIKAVEGHDVLSKLKAGYFRIHKGLSAFEQAFTGPMTVYRKTIKGRDAAWQAFEEKRAAAEQARLQAQADEQARKDREKAEKAAEKIKTPELREQRLAEAQTIIAPTIVVEAPKSSGRMQKVWKIVEMDQDMFFKSLATRPDLRGYVEINTTRLERSKAANNMFEVPGVKFTQIVR